MTRSERKTMLFSALTFLVSRAQIREAQETKVSNKVSEMPESAFQKKFKKNECLKAVDCLKEQLEACP
ncbi:MAG: hypothetical protein ACE5DM_05685 [Candidatus Nanoarchaeia archaeon]